MILSQPLVLAATLPHLINTFGAASVILSPILNMLLFAAAVYLVFHIFNIAQQNNLFRNVFAAIGVLSTYISIQDILSRSSTRDSFPPTVHPHHNNSSRRTFHMRSDETFFSPSSERSHDSNHPGRMHGR